VEVRNGIRPENPFPAILKCFPRETFAISSLTRRNPTEQWMVKQTQQQAAQQQQQQLWC